MNFLDGLFSVFNFFVKNDSISEYNNFTNNILPKIHIEYQKLNDENGDNFAMYMQKMKEEYMQTKNYSLYLPRVFAMVKKAMGLTLYKEHFDVQLFGGYILHTGRIAEMKTGEGKTFIGPLAAALHSLSGNAVIIITSNDYLAQRDAELLAPIYNMLGLSIGYITENMDSNDKARNYKANIIHASHNVIVFDYLRDRLVTNKDEKIQPKYDFVIVDEIDNCLIDSARTPLIISGSSKEKTSQYYSLLSPIIKSLQPHHYIIIKFEKAILTEEGFDYIHEQLIEKGINENIYERSNIGLFNVISNLLHVYHILKNGKDYLVSRKNEILLIDQSTHRTSEGRRFSHGLHSAIEAKEGVEIKEDSSISASTTYFTYITKFKKVSGMSGTCMTEQNEFINLYNLYIVKVPTNKPTIRDDHNNNVWLYRTRKLMYEQVAHMMSIKHSNRPVLICTPSVYESEMLYEVLQENNIEASLLNAKNAETEAYVIERAGLPGSITVTTGIAGRGTDILLGGSSEAEINELTSQYENEINNGNITHHEIREKVIEIVKERKQKVIECGGLLVLIVGLFESRKTEMQIRGRSGRQGEPGESMLLCSREDSLIEPALPQENAGGIEAIANAINFIEDKDVLQTSDINDAMREIQYVHSANDAEVRKNQAQLSNNAQCVSIYEDYKNYYYRDYIMDYENSLELHQKLVEKYIKTLKYDNIQQLINILSTEVFKDKKNPLLECDTIESVFNMINKHINNIYAENNNYDIILYAYDKCYEDFMIAEDGVRRTINMVVYGQMDPAAEFEKIIYKLLQNMMNKFTILLVEYAFYLPNMKRNCSGGVCDIEDKDDNDDFDIDKILDFNKMFENMFKDNKWSN